MNNQDALLIIDLQNDFMSGGALAVPNADEIVTPINEFAKKFQHVILTQDWHTSDHISFAASHQRAPFETIILTYGEQVLWPTHCVMGSYGAEFHPKLNVPNAQLIIRKGFNRGIDSYSAFLEADKKTKTGLTGYLHEHKIERVFCCGLATDYCVAYSAIDARAFGFEVFVIEDLCRGININNSVQIAWEKMKVAHIKRILSELY